MSDFVTKTRNSKTRSSVVIMDIKDAFGSMCHSKLEQILTEVRKKMPKTAFIYNLKYQYHGDRKYFNKKMVSFTENTSNLQVPNLKNARFMKTDGKKEIDTKSTINNIIKRMKLHIIQLKVGRKKLYRVRKGVLQGDPLSSALCNIYYGHLVQTHLQKFAKINDEQIFARGMDDFIFVTKNELMAVDFLRQMQKGFPDYGGCEIQKSKTATNLPIFENFENSRRKMRFCGAVLDPDDISCRPDFEGYHNRNIVYASSLSKFLCF